MTEKNVSDIEVKNNEGDVSQAGRDITTVGDTTIGEIYNKIVLPEIPPDNTDDKLLDSLDNNRTLLVESKRKLAYLVLEKSKNYKGMETAIKNIKMAGDNINNLINALSVRGHKCEHLPDESHYEHDTLDILRLQNIIINKHIPKECLYCGNEILINNRNYKKEMLIGIERPVKKLYIFDKCQGHSVKDNLKVSTSTTIYCKSCKNPVCVYFSNIENSIDAYIDSNFPEKQ